MITCWQMFTIAPRVLALSLFACSHLWWFLGGCVLHTCVVLLLLFLETKQREARPGYRWILQAVLVSLTFIFSFNPSLTLSEAYEPASKVIPNKVAYLCYYTCIYLENLILILFWYWNDHVTRDHNFHPTLPEHFSWFPLMALVTVLAGFFVGISFMLIYYGLLHHHRVSNLKGFKTCLVSMPHRTANVVCHRDLLCRMLL